MHKFDLLLNESHNVLDAAFWKELLQFITDLKPFCIFVTPPCSTYSRARHFYKQSPGPRPIRSRQHPNGFPRLSQKNRKKAEEGTLLAEKAWELITLALNINSHYLSEFPEDLGQTSTGVPASLWQMQQFQDVLATKGAQTFALFQCEYGAETPKPTRFVSSLKCFTGPMFPGVPTFDSQWNYLGPLPPSCPHPGQHTALIGTDDSGAWKTALAAHYPGPLCKFLADAVWAALSWNPSLRLGIFQVLRILVILGDIQIQRNLAPCLATVQMIRTTLQLALNWTTVQRIRTRWTTQCRG